MTWLSYVLLVLAVLLAAGWTLLLLALRALRRRTDELQAEVAALTPAPALAPDLEAAFGTGTRRLLVIEILNAVELATQRAKAARILGVVAPEMLRKIVVEQAAKDIVVQLAEEGVHAQVTVHAAR
jgi:hypothetical protein